MYVSWLIPLPVSVSLSESMFVKGVTEFVGCLTRDWSVVSSNPINGSRCFHEQERLSSLLSASWF